MTMPAVAPAAPTTPADTPSAATKAAEPKATKPNPADVVKAVPKTDQAHEAGEKKVRVRGYQRAAKVKETLASEPESEETTSEPAVERPSADSPGSAKPAAASAADSGAVEPNAQEKARAERNRRIAEIQAREETARQKRAQEAKGRESSGELEKLRKRLADLEPLESVFASEEALLEAAEKKGMSPEKLAQWMRTKLSDPQAVARREAQTFEQRIEAKFEAERAKLQADRDAFEATQREHTAAAQGQARARQFIGDASSKAETHPLTAQFLSARGEQHLVALASAVIVPYLPEDYDIENLHDHLEQYLEYVSVGGHQAAAPAPSSGHTPPPKTNGAAKPVTTLSNDLGSRRESVAEEVPAHRIPRSERIARVKRQLGGA